MLEAIEGNKRDAELHARALANWIGTRDNVSRVQFAAWILGSAARLHEFRYGLNDQQTPEARAAFVAPATNQEPEITGTQKVRL